MPVPPLPRLLQALRKTPPPLLLAGVVVVAGVASALQGRAPAPAAPGQDPQAEIRAAAASEAEDRARTALSEPVEAAFEAARKADVDRYLDCFTGTARQQLDRTRTEKGDPSLRDYLARLAAPVKGVAIDFTRKEETGPEAVTLPVELVYADRNEVQRFHLRRESGRWRIESIEGLRSAPTLIPYGTPMEQVR